MCETSREMPQYQCHKKVWALKIKDVSLGHTYPSGQKYAVITPEEEGYGLIEVSQDYVDKHNPQAGGYYVVYEGGYKSWSPAEAFESGYTKIEK